MIWISVFVVIANPISAAMLAWLVLHHKIAMSLGWIVRSWASMLCIALLIQAAGHVAILSDFRPPRTLAWLPFVASVNGLIWAAFLQSIIQRDKT